jgi:multiple sugar transport system ATP-binding protein
MASVSIRQLGKRYGDTQIIKGIDVDIRDGEFLVLVGPSGCGKSTLLRMIAGLENISSGELAIGGKLVNDVPAKARNIAMVFQNYALYPHMTVAGNIGFSMRMAGVGKQEIATRVQTAAAMLGLETYLDRYPRQLSGGQRQRVAMGRALVRDPQVFLFDEPLSNLDAKLRVQMRAEIRQLHRRVKTTMVYVTHDQVEAMTMADRIVVLRDGVVEQIGAPLELYDHPRNRFVAGFIGSPTMNFIDGKIVRNDGGMAFAAGDDILFPLNADAQQWEGRECVYGIRPEHLQLVSEGDGGSVRAVLESVEPTGSETHLSLSLGGHAGNEPRTLVCVSHERVAAGEGDALWLRPADGRYHLFDSASGNALTL